MNTGERIKQLRIARGMTLEELGQKVGVGKSTVRKWETGAIANMRRDKIAKLADALGTTIDDILGLESPPQTVSQEEDDFPEVRMIARAGKKMSPERKADMIRMLKMMFPEEFGESL
jgi:transcriptional regulator with XRE-family HTH domain